MRPIGDNRSETAESMHRLDVDAQVRGEFTGDADVFAHVARREQCTSAVVNVEPVGPSKFVPVERGASISDNRPRLRVSRCLAGEVSGIEFGEGGVDVVEVENDDRLYPLVGVDLVKAQRLAVEHLGRLVAGRPSETTEEKTLPASRDNP